MYCDVLEKLNFFFAFSKPGSIILVDVDDMWKNHKLYK